MNHVRMADDTAVVTATAEFKPLKELSKLEIELREKKFKGTVVFDLLYFNGLCDNRFIEILFDGKEFNRSSYKISGNIDSALKTYQDLFFSSQPMLLASSVLSTQEVKNFTNIKSTNITNYQSKTAHY